MRRDELMSLIVNYLTDKQLKRHSGKLMISINMSQGGFSEPNFSEIRPDSARHLTNGLKFVIVE